jgi:phage shock protein A
MSIFSRISDIVTANLHALLDRAENPEVMLEQMIREMEESHARARRYAAAAIAAESRPRRDRDDNRGQVEQWKARAQEALAAGREELARRALARKQEHDVLARSPDDE